MIRTPIKIDTSRPINYKELGIVYTDEYPQLPESIDIQNQIIRAEESLARRTVDLQNHLNDPDQDQREITRYQHLVQYWKKIITDLQKKLQSLN